MQDTDDPSNQNQNSTELGVHDDHLVQGVADVQKVVIGHCWQKVVIQICKQHANHTHTHTHTHTHLGDTGFIGYNFALCLEAPQHLWDGGGCDTDVYKGQARKEEVHGGVEVGI